MMGNYSCMHCLAETDNDDEWCDDCRAERNTPDPTPSVQPVRAWAVYDKTGDFIELIDRDMTERERGASTRWWDSEFAFRSPHRLIRVEIREVNDE